MSYSRWFLLSAMLALTALVIGSCTLLSTDFSPRGYVDRNYERFAERDIGDDAEAHTSPNAPDEVAAELTDAWEPAGRHVDGSGIYLQYADDAIVILPLAAGSLILVEKLRTAYRRYHSVVAGYWGWSGGSSGNRGGGPGTGK